MTEATILALREQQFGPRLALQVPASVPTVYRVGAARVPASAPAGGRASCGGTRRVDLF